MTLLHQTLVLLLGAVVAVPLFRRLGLGSVLGYLAAGVVIGPFGLRLITDVHSILQLSEFGVVLLLFLIGLELNPGRLWVMRRAVFGLGAAQVVATSAVLGGLGVLLGAPPAAALVGGAGLALSSTAFVLQVLAEKQQLTTPHGSAAFAVLLFQDLAVLPLLVVVPMLGGAAPAAQRPTMALLGISAAGTLGALVLAGRYLVRPVFRIVATSGNQEILTAMALLIVVGTASLMHGVGLPLTLGAFVAGVMLAESEYRHELQADIEPFKGLLLGLFFICVGMGANLRQLREAPLLVLGLAVGIMALKGMVLFLVARLFGHSSGTARHLACTLPQGGEFAFVVFGIAVAVGVMDPHRADLLVLAVTLSMALTPLAFALDEKLLSRWLAREVPRDFDAVEEEDTPVVIAGFGRFGQIVGRVLRTRGIGFTALDSSATQVDFLRRWGNKVYYGDPARLDLLRAARVERARVFVLAMDDMAASLKVAKLVKEHFPQVQIFARARNRQHAYQLLGLGITALVRETFHSSLLLTAQVLQALGFPEERARETVDRFARYDETLVRSMYVHRDDEKRLMQSAQQAAAELENLFATDTAPEGGG